MRSFRKGAASYVGSGLWWITDKLYGDEIFKAVRPMIPDWLAHPGIQDLTRWAIAYGPPMGLFALGTFFFLKNRAEEVPKNSVLLVWLEGFRRKLRERISKVLPTHIIALGLLIAFGGLVWLMLRAPGSAPVSEASISKEPMLSGRTVSGPEVVTRLERLEKEHANTVIDLTTTKQQLEAKNHELDAVKAQYPELTKQGAKFADAAKRIIGEPPASKNATYARTILLSSRYYSPTHKNEVSGRLDKISETINKADKEILRPAELALLPRFMARPASEASDNIEKLRAVEATVQKMKDSLYGDLLANEQDYREEMNAILFPMEPFTDFARKAEEYRKSIEVWMKLGGNIADEETSRGFREMVVASSSSFSRAKKDFVEWLSQRQELINKTRMELRL